MAIIGSTSLGGDSMRPNSIACKCRLPYLYYDLSEGHVGHLAAVGAMRPKGRPILRRPIVSVRL